MGICSMILHTRPENVRRVCDQIEALDGAELHAASEQGKLVVSVDLVDPHRYSETIMKLHNLSGVLSAALIYEFSEPAV